MTWNHYLNDCLVTLVPFIELELFCKSRILISPITSKHEGTKLMLDCNFLLSFVVSLYFMNIRDIRYEQLKPLIVTLSVVFVNFFLTFG